jgi:serine/threonine protein kinase
MTLSTGTKLSHYEITSQLGKGGMGEVYRAKDQTLGRDVAIKVLPEEFAKDADRVARFQREAKLLASLNHPNIASIYGLEESEGTHFLVLELIEGDTLAYQIKKGSIPVEESLKLALQIAEALEAAHEKGVIHRDLKPANIKVTPDGKVKVLDFGLAKAFAGDQAEVNLSHSPTLSDMATQQGLILGTAAYMSPEQARGKPVDKRTDIWAFGCVLYEMLTGKAAFQGEDVTEILAAVVKSGVNLDLLPANIHPRVREVITRCLQKDQRRRYSGISDVQYEIEQVLTDSSGILVPPISVPMESRSTTKTLLPWAIAFLGIIVAGVVVWNIRAPEPHRVIRFDYELTEDQQFVNLWNPLLAVSPDGNQLVYSTSEGLYLRSMDRLDGKLISGSNENPLQPFFSPDGQWVGYYAPGEQKLKKIAASGGVPISLCSATGSARPRWNMDDMIVYGQSEGIMRVSANGGTPELIVPGEGKQLYAPQILPGGDLVLFTITDGNESQIAVQSLKSKERKILSSGIHASYLPTGHIVYGLGNNLFVVPIDLDTLELAGGSVPMVEGLFWMGATSAPQYAISASGTLVYIPGGFAPTERRILARVDRDGRIDKLNAPANAYVSPRVSPDGTKLAVQSIKADSSGTLWVYDLTEERAIRQLTFEGSNCRPIWTPDNKRITFSSDRDGTMSIYWMPADGSGVAERLTTAEEGTNHWPGSWSPDGETLAFLIERDLFNDWDIYLVSPGNEPECLYDRPETAYLGAQFSPDGRWIAYSLDDALTDPDVFVEPFPPTGARWRITQGGGRGVWPIWSPDGGELIYRPTTFSGQPIVLKAVDIVMNPEFAFRNERTLPIEGFSTVSYYRGYDIAPDGNKFFMTFPADSAEASKRERRRIHIVLNWFEELKQKVPVD